MIARYSRPEMTTIWEEANRFKIWYNIEAYACEAQAAIGVIPVEAAEAVWKIKDKPYTPERIRRIHEIENETKHDVIAFLTELAEHVGDSSRFVHQGMTSSDVLDTCLSIQLTQATDILLSGLDRLLGVIKERAFEFKFTPCMGRSHGIHAEPVTFGVKLARFYAEFNRSKERLINARSEVNICSISGATGTFANISPTVEEYVASKMGLERELISSQIIPRDRHAIYFATLGVVASSIENLAIELRHLQRTEVREAQEFFSEGQKGSSAMPHKRNPILSENLTGLARVIRSAVVPAMENVALWHERDISHSSVERIIGPDVTITLDFALSRLANVIEKLVVYPVNMKDNLDKFGGIHDAQRVMLYLTQKNVSREEAYRIVQVAAMKVWDSFGEGPVSKIKTQSSKSKNAEFVYGENRLLHFLSKDPDIKKVLQKNELDSLIKSESLDYHFSKVDIIFERVFGTAE